MIKKINKSSREKSYFVSEYPEDYYKKGRKKPKTAIFKSKQYVSWGVQQNVLSHYFVSVVLSKPLDAGKHIDKAVRKCDRVFCIH